MDLKKQLVRSLIWNTALHGSESWALKKCDEKLVTAFEMWVCRQDTSDAENQMDRTENQHMDPENIDIPEEKGILDQIKHRKLSKYCYWKRRSDSVVPATIEGEIERKCFSVRRRTAWIDDVRRWTGDDMNVARTNAMERRYDCW